MLAPDDLDPVIGALNGFHANVLAADKLSGCFKSLKVYRTPREADWVQEIRQYLPELYRVGDLWQQDKITILPQILHSVSEYDNRFRTISMYLRQAESGQDAAKVLDRLINQISECIQNTAQAKMQFADWIRGAKQYLELMDESITAAWKEIAVSEKRIIYLSEQIVKVQNTMESLDGLVSLHSISSGTLGSAKDVLSQMVSIIYKVAVEGGSVPIVGVLNSFFSLGKMFYDIFSNSAKMEAEIKKLGEYRVDLDLEQISLAQTKSLLMFLYELKVYLEKQEQTLREMEGFWQNESRMVMTVKESFIRDKNYSKDNPEIQQLGIAESVWHSLGRYADDIMDSFQDATDSGKQIQITI